MKTTTLHSLSGLFFRNCSAKMMNRPKIPGCEIFPSSFIRRPRDVDRLTFRAPVKTWVETLLTRRLNVYVVASQMSPYIVPPSFSLSNPISPNVTNSIQTQLLV